MQKQEKNLLKRRDEVMKNLLNPCSTTIEASPLPPDLKALSLSVHFAGWRIPNKKFKSWATKMAISYKPIWRKAGILEAVMASTNTIPKDTDLVLNVAEKWCPETNTFVFPWGEATVTLEDVMVLLCFSVLGSPIFAGLDSEGEKIKAKLEREWCKIANDNKNSLVYQVGWIKRFMGCGDELEHVAFLVLWLSYFVFPLRYYHINRSVFSIAVHLSIGTRIALAPAILAHLYADLSLLKIHITAFAISKDIEVIDLTSLFKLVEVWTWERFKEVQPLPNVVLKGVPRLALWHDQKYKTRRVRQVLDYSKSDGFEWRPYTKTVQNWEFPKFYPERAMSVLVDPNLDDEFLSFARCLKVSELVGIGCVEHYFPNRVASQFGMDQDVPGPVKRKKLSQKEAWNEYSKPIDDLTLYIPSRSATGCDTQMFKEWRRKSCTSEKNLVVEADEASKPRNMTCMRREKKNDKRLECRKRVRGDDESSIVPSSSKMKRTSENVRKVAANFINKRRKYLKLARDKRLRYMKRAHENNEKAMRHRQKQIAVDNDEDSDSLTVSQLMKKYSNVKNSGEDACEWLGEKSKLEEDINDSVPRQKLDSIKDDGDETIQPPQKEQRTDENNSSDPPLGEGDDIAVSPPATIQNCEDELDSDAEKMIILDDGCKEPECLLPEDGAIIAGDKASSGEKEDDTVYDDKVIADGCEEPECLLPEDGVIAGEILSSGEKEDDAVDDDSLIQKKLASMANNSEPSPCQKLANGDETQGHDCLHHDKTLGAEETRKPNGQLEDLEMRNEDVVEVDVGNDSYRRSLIKLKDSFEESSHELKKLDSKIDELIIEAKRNLAWLNEQRAKI